jgi:choline transporter-like protein 2/4/5
LKTITTPVYQVLVQQMVSNSCICPPQLNYNENETCNPNVFESECKDINANPCLSSGCYLTSNTVPEYIYMYQLIIVIVSLWFLFFISAFGQMVLAITFSTWYWTFIKRNVPAHIIARSLWITFK